MNEPYIEIISIITAYFKDKANNESLKNIKEACYKLSETETEARRRKSSEIIKLISKLDVNIKLFKKEYNKIKENLAEEAKNCLENFINDCKLKRKRLKREKDSL